MIAIHPVMLSVVMATSHSFSNRTATAQSNSQVSGRFVGE